MMVNLTQSDSLKTDMARSVRTKIRPVAATLLALAAAGWFGPVWSATQGSVLSSVAEPGMVKVESANSVSLSGEDRHTVKSGLNQRMALLSKELNLDEAQQAAVRRLLLQQREQTIRVWNDETTPAAVRIKATQGLADRTAEQIRALLTDAQRSHYSQPRNRDAEQHVASEDLESWMRGVAPKGLPAPQQ
jgi:hypothetical protein